MRRSERKDLGELMKEPPSVDARVHAHALDITALAFSRMEELGMTQADLARKMGKSPARVSQIMSAQYNMTLETISELEEALGVTLIRTDEPRWDVVDTRVGHGRSESGDQGDMKTRWVVLNGRRPTERPSYGSYVSTSTTRETWHGEAKEG